MPLYEYSCEKCEMIEEFLEPVTAPKTRLCSHCGHRSHRIPSVCSFGIEGFANGQDLTEDDV